MSPLRSLLPILSAFAVSGVVVPSALRAECGDPQLMTDDPWYAGELSCSTFPRLNKTEAEVYQRVTGRKAESDEDKALAAWLWRSTHFAHAEEGAPDTFDHTSHQAWNREYWTGMFGFGFGICGTTHAQFSAEMHQLLGPFRGRVAGVNGHNSFEVFLTGGAYGKGDWVLLDQDQSAVIYQDDGSRLIGMTRIKSEFGKVGTGHYIPPNNHGWRFCGFAPGDVVTYSDFRVAEYADGYSGPPPMVHLRAGESLRRYLQPGLDDGKTFVWWGRNYNAGGVPGIQRDLTWVNQPDKIYQAPTPCPGQVGLMRFANAAYTYKPDFAKGGYKEGVIDEGKDHVTFEFYTPYVIGSTPPNGNPWGVYDKGGKNGLVIAGKLKCAVSVSIDQGKTWQDAGAASDGMDLTDLVKGQQQYWLRLGADPKTLAGSGLTIKTVCECNPAILPHLHDGTNRVAFAASGLALVDAGPNKDQAEAHVVEGAIGSSAVTLELATPRKEKAVHVYASCWQASGCPPKAGVKYQIEYSLDAGKTWKPVVKDWEVVRHDPEPGDWWSQTIANGDVDIEGGATGPVRVRFANNGGVQFLKVEAQLAYQVQKQGAVDVTFAWTENGQAKTATHAYPAAAGKEDKTWTIAAGSGVKTAWVECAAK